jgi:gluconolactonase
MFTKLLDVLDLLHAGAAREIFAEGPAVDERGAVFFTDESHLPESRILRYDPAAKALTVHRERAGRANGMTFDRRGRLIACEGSRAPGGNRRVARYEPDGSVTTLADRYNGRRLNSPNDVTVDQLNRVWFTDPRYIGPREDIEQDCEAVYRIDHPGTGRARVVRVLGRDWVARPNGIAVAANGATLYVADTPLSPGTRNRLLAFSIRADGSLTGGRIVVELGEGRGIDGFRLNRRGIIYAAVIDRRDGGRSGIAEIDPNGAGWVRLIPTPEVPGNCAWGGPDGRTLYVTASRSLYSLECETPGYVLYPALWPNER